MLSIDMPVPTVGWARRDGREVATEHRSPLKRERTSWPGPPAASAWPPRPAPRALAMQMADPLCPRRPGEGGNGGEEPVLLGGDGEADREAERCHGEGAGRVRAAGEDECGGDGGDRAGAEQERRSGSPPADDAGNDGGTGHLRGAVGEHGNDDPGAGAVQDGGQVADHHEPGGEDGDGAGKDAEDSDSVVGSFLATPPKELRCPIPPPAPLAPSWFSRGRELPAGGAVAVLSKVAAEDVGDEVPRDACGWVLGAVPDRAQGPAQVQFGHVNLDEPAGGQVVSDGEFADDGWPGAG